MTDADRSATTDREARLAELAEVLVDVEERIAAEDVAAAHPA